MSDVKTSAETLVSALSGAELIRIVQSGLNARCTIEQIVALIQLGATVTPTFSSTITIDLTDYAGIPEVIVDLETTPVSGDFTFDVVNGQTDRQKITVIVKQDVTGSRIWTSGSHLAMTDDITSIVLSTASNKVDYLGFRWNASKSKAVILATNRGA